MKLIAHRGWTAGAQENTLAAFARAAGDDRVSGVEFDVCRATHSGALMVSHDPPTQADRAPTLAAVLSFLAPTKLELFVEVKQTGLASEIADALVAADLAHRSVVFAFPAVARTFPWHGARPVRLGVIVPYPWDLARWMRTRAPDLLLLGWDERAWTRIAVRTWWSVFSLARMARRHRVPVVVGIVQRADDLAWLARQHVYGAVADIDRTIAPG